VNFRPVLCICTELPTSSLLLRLSRCRGVTTIWTPLYKFPYLLSYLLTTPSRQRAWDTVSVRIYLQQLSVALCVDLTLNRSLETFLHSSSSNRVMMMMMMIMMDRSTPSWHRADGGLTTVMTVYTSSTTRQPSTPTSYTSTVLNIRDTPWPTQTVSVIPPMNLLAHTCAISWRLTVVYRLVYCMQTQYNRNSVCTTFWRTRVA